MRSKSGSADDILLTIRQIKTAEKNLLLLSDDEQNSAISSFYEISYNKNDVIIKAGTPVSYAYFLMDGLLYQAKPVMEGFIILNFILPGEFFGINCLFSGSIYNYSVVATMHSKVLVMEKNTFNDLLKGNNNLLFNICGKMASNNNHLINKLASSMSNRLPGKLARALLFFSNDVFRKNRFYLPVNNAELASFIGVSRERLHKTIMDFQKDRIICKKGNRIEICNKEMLERLALHG